MTLEEPILIKNIKKFIDQRGSFSETYKKSFLLENYNLNVDFVQDNHSISSKNTVRGLHYQWDKPMDKLIRVPIGKIIDVVVNIKKDSPNFGKVYYFELSEENNYQLFVPSNFAHGFVCISEVAHVMYKCSSEYNKNAESGINPFDKDLNIDWKCDKDNYVVSDKDKNSKCLKDYILDPKF